MYTPFAGHRLNGNHERGQPCLGLALSRNGGDGWADAVVAPGGRELNPAVVGGSMWARGPKAHQCSALTPVVSGNSYETALETAGNFVL